MSLGVVREETEQHLNSTDQALSGFAGQTQPLKNQTKSEGCWQGKLFI